MDRLEKAVFSNITDTFQLLKVNWNAYKQNPPCEKEIDGCIKAIDTFITVLNDHQRTKNFYRDNFKNRHLGEKK